MEKIKKIKIKNYDDGYIIDKNAIITGGNIIVIEEWTAEEGENGENYAICYSNGEIDEKRTANGETFKNFTNKKSDEIVEEIANAIDDTELIGVIDDISDISELMQFIDEEFSKEIFESMLNDAYTEVKRCNDVYIDFDPETSIYINMCDFKRLVKSYIKGESVRLRDWLDLLELSPSKAFIDYDLHSQDSDTISELLAMRHLGEDYTGDTLTPSQISEICDLWGVDDFTEIPYWRIIDTIYNECDDVDACGWLDMININIDEVADRLAFEWASGLKFFKTVTGFKVYDIDSEFGDMIAVEFYTVEDLRKFCEKFTFKIID